MQKKNQFKRCMAVCTLNTVDVCGCIQTHFLCKGSKNNRIASYASDKLRAELCFNYVEKKACRRGKYSSK